MTAFMLQFDEWTCNSETPLQEQVMSENRLAVVLALIIFAMVIVGWIVQLGGGLRAGTRLGSYGECQSEAHWEAAKCAP